MSHTPEPPEPGRPNLRRAIASLPTHEPDEALWARINRQLSSEPVAESPISGRLTLPAHEPDDALWELIAARLDFPVAAASEPAAPAVVRRLWPARDTARRVMVLAASLLLLVGLAWWQRPSPASSGPHESMTYSQEIVAEAPVAVSLSTQDPLAAEGRAFIDAKCSALPAVCQSNELQSLREQLNELETEEAGLLRDTQRYGNSPELVRHQVRVTTLKATVTRELIRLLIS